MSNNSELFTLIFFVVIIFLVMFRGSWVDEAIAYRASETQGYSDAKVIDHSWFAIGLRGCSSRDAARFTLRATNTNGKEVEYYVCTGWIFKSATIRTK